MYDDTIAAVATPTGEGGVGIIRISGPGALDTACAVFSRPGELRSRPRELVYGHIISRPEEGAADEVLAVYMPKPRTYTAEDVVEIDCHRGRIALAETLSLILQNGARLAEPGEFTKRAFLNGRLDLSQAEAVMDVVAAKTTGAFEQAMDQLRGRFSEEISAIRAEITDILVNIHVNIDYPDEDIEEVTKDKLKESLLSVRGKIDDMIASADAGRIMRDGLSVVIAGRPNVGKSSLMNALLRESRAIVTDIPGTTRDTIEEFVSIRGIPVKLTDTAGIRETDDVVEKIGIDRTRETISSADVVLLIIDAYQGLAPDDLELIDRLNPASSLILYNKSDKGICIDKDEMDAASSSVRYLVTSMTDPCDVRAVEDAIYAIAAELTGSQKPGAIVTNARHKQALTEAARSLSEAYRQAEEGLPPEIIEIDIASAYEHLGFITGDSVQDDVINEVFSRFCLGK